MASKSNGSGEDAVGKPRLDRVRDVANELTVSVRTVWRLIAANELKTVYLGRSVRITKESVERFIQRGGVR